MVNYSRLGQAKYFFFFFFLVFAEVLEIIVINKYMIYLKYADVKDSLSMFKMSFIFLYKHLSKCNISGIWMAPQSWNYPF